MRYIITIVDRESGDISTLVKVGSISTNETIDKELGGWENLHTTSTSGRFSHPNEYMQTGTTRDDKKAFSIICISR